MPKKHDSDAFVPDVKMRMLAMLAVALVVTLHAMGRALDALVEVQTVISVTFLALLFAGANEAGFHVVGALMAVLRRVPEIVAVIAGEASVVVRARAAAFQLGRAFVAGVIVRQEIANLAFFADAAVVVVAVRWHLVLLFIRIAFIGRLLT